MGRAHKWNLIGLCIYRSHIDQGRDTQNRKSTQALNS